MGKMKFARTEKFLADFVLLIIAFLGGFYIRSDLHFDGRINTSLFIGAIIFTTITLLAGKFLGLYSKKYEPGSFEEILVINSQVFVGSIFTLSLRFLQSDLNNYPRSVPIISGLIFLFLNLGLRVVLRLKSIETVKKNTNQRNVAIYGAGKLGSYIANLVNMEPKLFLVGFIEDNPEKSNLIIKGKRVLGNYLSLEDLVKKYRINQIIVAISEISNSKMAQIEEVASKLRVNIKIIPSAAQLISGIGNLRELISLNEEDLLGRRAVEVDKKSIANLISNKKVLITGAGGSIGAEIAKQCSSLNPEKLYLLDRDESALHSLELELNGTGLMNSETTLLSDIRDFEAIRIIFNKLKPDIVFHAAALKHLPILENFPDEANKTNVLGTKNVVNASLECGVGILVNISTDKAADPISVLGKSKFEAELITYEASLLPEVVEKKAKYLSVRFGNVIGSRGSVLHTFKYQIDKDLPLTITHPDVTRYFMTVKEAVSLVLQSAVIGQSGETLILDMGEPVKIQDVANFMIEQSGKKIPIEYTGLRSGEKLHEILSSKTENLESREHPKIFHTKVGGAENV